MTARKDDAPAARMRLRLAAPVLMLALFAGASAQDSTPAPDTTPVADAPAAAEAESPPAPAYLDLRRIRLVMGDAAAGQSKSELCAACHGPQGTAIVPMFPNLAGQRIDYLYWKLVGYKQGAYPTSAMAPLASTLEEADMRDLAAYYASLPGSRSSVTADGAQDATDATAPSSPQVLERGEQLYQVGDVAKGIPPCQGCHGSDARGHPLAGVVDAAGHAPYAVFPALRGQKSQYLQAKLGEFHAGTLHASTADFVMSGVGRRLDEESIQALSAWLSSLDP